MVVGKGKGPIFQRYDFRDMVCNIVRLALTLEDSQSMHSFCLTGEYVVAALQDQSKAALKDEVCLFDFSGELPLGDLTSAQKAHTYRLGCGLYAPFAVFRLSVLPPPAAAPPAVG